MIDVLVAGAGPAGAVAAAVLARAGARVCLVDRENFPREKLCGDTINPGTLALLRRLRLAEVADARGLRVDGMVVSGEGGVTVEGRYPRGLHGRAIVRAEFDSSLVNAAIRTGAVFEPGTRVCRAVLGETRGIAKVEGIVVRCRGGAERAVRARVVIAAEGRRSPLAFGLGLARAAPGPRRWAIGGYFEGVEPWAPDAALGEMHIRRGHYIGVAPLPDGRTNVCFVKPSSGADPEFRDARAMLAAAIAADPRLSARFGRACAAAPPRVLGPLAVEATARSIDGLILAGDAAGFIDPMTGDGLRFAVRGGELAAEAALRALEHGWPGVHDSLRAVRRREFRRKVRFDRTLRALVASPRALGAAVRVARVAPRLVRAIVARAGDCDCAD